MVIQKIKFGIAGVLVSLCFAFHGEAGATEVNLAGTYQLKVAHSGKCLDVSGVSQNNGANVYQWQCHDMNNQRWHLKPNGNGFYKLKSVHSGKCLDVYGGYYSNGANLIQWSCHSGYNQQFEFIDLGNGKYHVKARHSGKVLDVAGASQSNGGNVLQWPIHGGDNQKWELVEVAAPAPQDFSGIYRIKAKHSGKCFDVSGVSQNRGANIHQWGCHNGDNQRWQVLPAGDEGFYKIIALHSGKCAKVNRGSYSYGASIIQWTCKERWNQQFQFYDAGEGYFHIKARHSGQVMDVAGHSNNNGANILQWPIHGGDNQKWELIKEEYTHNKNIIINTTSTGYDVAGDVNHFPFLVRLSRLNFAFSEARPNGEDIRFFGSDGKILFQSIESWDAVKGEANIWVRIPKVLGNNADQYIEMHWGNSDVTLRSQPEKVFDASNGFVSVWHLGSDPSNPLSDATGGFQGNSGGAMTSSDVVPGVVGNGLDFDGVDDHIQINGLQGNQRLITVSGWANLRQRDNNGGEIISLGDAVGLRLDDIPRNGALGFYHPYSGDWRATVHATNYAGTGWHYVTYTLDDYNHVQKVYVDGELKATTNETVGLNYGGVGSNTYIGRHGNGNGSYDFNGVLDEVRVACVVRNSDWVKLTFENQRNDIGRDNGGEILDIDKIRANLATAHESGITSVILSPGIYKINGSFKELTGYKQILIED